jgi:hypothetical protein
MTRKVSPLKPSLVVIFSGTFAVVYVMAVLFAHYFGLRNRTYGAWPRTTYESLSWTHAFEFALPVALIASIWATIKSR